MRAGFLRRVASGIYELLPLGARVVRKIERIVREEMDAAGAQEVILPIMQPRELWEESGRWAKYGPEMMRLKDRADRDFGLGPTAEEVITDLVRSNVSSYRDLPLNLYQIGDKFRDEIRPRFGLLRGREFIMKDGYSFDRDEEGMRRSYQAMYEAYGRVFTRAGAPGGRWRRTPASSGATSPTSSWSRPRWGRTTSPTARPATMPPTSPWPPTGVPHPPGVRERPPRRCIPRTSAPSRM